MFLSIIIYCFYFNPIFRNIKDKEKTILSTYIKEQKEFCENFDKFYDRSIENKLELLDIKINGLEYKMYVTPKHDQHPYKKEHCFEKKRV